MKNNRLITLLCVLVTIFVVIVVCWSQEKLAKTSQKMQENEQILIKNYDEEIAELQGQIVELQNSISELQTNLNDVQDKNKSTEIILDDEEKELFAKVVSYYCKNETSATKTYVGCVLLNRMCFGKIPFLDVINSLGVAQNNFEAVNYENEDLVIIERLSRSSYEEVDKISSGALYFYNTEYDEKASENDLLLLFTSGKYTFFTDLTFG